MIVTQKQAGRFLSASTLGTLFSQPTPGQPDNLGMNPLYFLAGAWLDGNMNPTTPGFVWLPNVNPSLQQVFYGCSGQ